MYMHVQHSLVHDGWAIENLTNTGMNTRTYTTMISTHHSESDTCNTHIYGHNARCLQFSMVCLIITLMQVQVFGVLSALTNVQ